MSNLTLANSGNDVLSGSSVGSVVASHDTRIRAGLAGAVGPTCLGGDTDGEASDAALLERRITRGRQDGANKGHDDTQQKASVEHCEEYSCGGGLG